MMRPRSRPRATLSVTCRSSTSIPATCRAARKRLRPRRGAGARPATHSDVRYNERSAAERVNGRVKDDFGGRYVRVRGHAKVLCHLMFGILALAIDQLMRLVT